jgi:hypothetical protein
MGKWAEVHCNCADRAPSEGSDFLFDQPHRRKRRLTKKQTEEVRDWEHAHKNMFQCGHRSGLAIELGPENIIKLGYLLAWIFGDEDGSFRIFAKVGDWRFYKDELLLIQPDEAALWLVEIDAISQALQGVGNLQHRKITKLVSEFLRIELSETLDLKQRLDDISVDLPFARTAFVKETVQHAKAADPESTVKKITDALMDAARLCRASIETRNPVRLLW